MRIAPLIYLAVVTMIGCGGGGDDEPQPLRVSARGSDLLVIREAADWLPVALDADGRAEIAVSGPYELVRVCAPSRWTRVVLAGPRDVEEELAMDCVTNPATVQVTVTVAGGDSTSIYIGDSAALTQNQVTLRVTPGVHDVVVRTATSRRLVIRRGVTFDGPTTLTVDPAAEGVAMVQRAYSNPNGGRGFALLQTAGGTGAGLDADAAVLWVPPASALEPGDSLYASLYEENASQRARRVMEIDPAATDLVQIPLPAPFETVQFATAGLASASWTVPGEWPWATVAAYDLDVGGDPFNMWQVDAHRPSRPDDDPSEVAMPDVTTIPGWQDDWTVNGGAPGFTIHLWRPGTGYEVEELTGWARF